VAGLGEAVNESDDAGRAGNMFTQLLEGENCGSAQMPAAPTTSPQDVADPYGS
jgi:hypothetical protein